MNPITRRWRTWKHSRKFAKIGKGCRFKGEHLEIDGHVEMGDYSRCRDHCVLRTNGEGKIIIGSRSGLSYFCIIEATNLVQIGDGTGIAEFTVIRDTNHLVFGTNAHWRFTPQIAKPVIIGNDVLIGSRCYIMPGVTIGDGAVIQAGSLVTRNVGSYEVWAGSPARKIAHRTENVPAFILRETEALLKEQGVEQDRRGMIRNY